MGLPVLTGDHQDHSDRGPDQAEGLPPVLAFAVEEEGASHGDQRDYAVDG